MVPDALIEAPWCGPYELAVYVAVRMLAKPGDTVRAGVADIGKVFGVSKAQVRRSLDPLSVHGWLVVERRNGSHTRYTVRDRPMVGVVDVAETPADLVRTVEVVTAADRAKVAGIVDGLAAQVGAVRRPDLSTGAVSQSALSQSALTQSATALTQSATALSQSALSALETRRDKESDGQAADCG
jgi:hypothetical protein